MNVRKTSLKRAILTRLFNTLLCLRSRPWAERVKNTDFKNITLRGSNRGLRDDSGSPSIYDVTVVAAICEMVLKTIKFEISVMMATVLQQEHLPIKNELEDFRTSLDFFNVKHEEMKNEICS